MTVPTTVAKVISEAGHADVTLSCGHTFGLAALPIAHPFVGQAYNCGRCNQDAWDAAHPPLSDAQIAAIEATMPTCPHIVTVKRDWCDAEDQMVNLPHACPTGQHKPAKPDSLSIEQPCGKPIKYVHFIVHSNHKFDYEIDAMNGEVLAYSRHYDDVEKQPAEVYTTAAYSAATGKPFYCGIEVECADRHVWNEPRLKLLRDDIDDESWAILPATDPTPTDGPVLA